jgi:hypothetical protein
LSGIEKVSATLDKSKNSRLLFHPSFDETIAELKKHKILLPKTPTDLELDFATYGYPQNGELVVSAEAFGKYKLDYKEGQKLCNETPICAYDESVNKYEGLEGTAYLTSHSMVIHGQTDFIPVNLLTFYFYTRSTVLSEDSKFIKYSEDVEVDSKKDYIVDREKLLSDNVPEKSAMFIDGPLIGSQMTRYTLDLNNMLLRKGVAPIFFVKNSSSNLVIENVSELKRKYNSDMHWAYSFLGEGERTNFFRYEDKENRNFAKFFCYLKAFDVSPHRIEIDVNTYKTFSHAIDNLVNMIYYLLIVQGDLKNPQIRSIAIAEKFARSTLKLINLPQMMRDLGITPTMNQERFAW